jgi:uncharacterized protein (DUF302 family)
MAYYSRKIRMPFHEVLGRVTQNLESQGFEVVTIIDFQDAFQQKLNIGFRNYKILHACNPHLAYKAISLESHIGIMLPCNIVIQEHENGEIEVSTINPLENLDEGFSTTQLIDLASEIGIRLRAAVDYIHRAPSKTSQESLRH